MGEKIVVVGAGIVGLYTAFLLSRQDKARHITVIAEYLPGDQSDKYVSPVAGSNFSTISGEDEAALFYDKMSYQMLTDLVKEFEPYDVIKQNPAIEFYQEPMSDAKLKSLQSYIPDLTLVPKEELIPGATMGIKYTTFNFNAPKWCKFLKSYLEDLGVIFIRRRLNHIKEAYLSADTTEIVFNCTGNGAATLGGVADSECYPIRGQVLLVRAPHVQENFSFWSHGEFSHIMPRVFSGGICIVGGYYQIKNSCTDTFGYESSYLWKRIRRFYPKLFEHGDPEIVREVAGLRPGRTGGARIEKQVLENGKVLIHNYGAGGTGYQSGLGMAYKAVSLVPLSPHL